jgi:hypothetical protein
VDSEEFVVKRNGETDGKASFNWPEEFRLKPRIRDEVEYIIDQFARHGITIEAVISGDRLSYMYRAGEILVLFDYLPFVMSVLGIEGEARDLTKDPEREDPPVVPVVEGVVVLRLRPDLGVTEAVNRVDRALGPGIATPNHVITVAPGDVGICPATEPQPVYQDMEPFPSACPAGPGAGTRIYVADTGLLTGQVKAGDWPWLNGVTGVADPNTPQGGIIQPYYAHGTFVAGVLRCLAPAASIYVDAVFVIAGSVVESVLVRRLSTALTMGVDLVHLSVAASTRHDRPMISFARWLKVLAQYQGVTCVVAAGNNGSPVPTWPAAFPDVVSVGALARDWRSRADFSNSGGWVDVYAPGRDLINAYATGDYQCYAAPYTGNTRKFHGMAMWSGTSFSTPIVTGLIAARMSRTGENGQQAAAALLAEAHARAIPGVGAIALPNCGDITPCASRGERCGPPCAPAGPPCGPAGLPCG